MRLARVLGLVALLLASAVSLHAQPAAADSGPTAPATMQVTSPDGLNLRAGPGLDHKVLVVLPEGAGVSATASSADGQWVLVSYAGLVGWVNSRYLAPVVERPVQPSRASFIWPVAGRAITTYFGPAHDGIDIDQYPSGGNPVVAVANGTVTFAGGNPCCSYGLYVKVEHPDGTLTLYAHLQSIEVAEGQAVAQGQVLGTSGNTGRSTGAHLHFEMYRAGVPVDPLLHLPRPATP